MLLVGLGGFTLWQFGPRFGFDLGKMLSGTSSSSSSSGQSTAVPVISGIKAITDSKGATITWTTDQLTSSQVEYGATITYGSVMPAFPDKDPAYKDPATGQYKYLGVTSHSVDIPGLKASTTYHYRVKSKNKAGSEAVSADQTLQTLAVPPAE